VAAFDVSASLPVGADVLVTGDKDLLKRVRSLTSRSSIPGASGSLFVSGVLEVISGTSDR